MLHIDCASPDRRVQGIAAAAAACRRGDVVLVPTESAYAVATDAFAARGREAIRLAKGQSASVPLPVMVPAASTVGGLAARVPDAAHALMAAFWPGSLTILLPAQPTLAWEVAGQTPIAIRMPLHPVLLALLAQTGPLAVTAANSPGLDAPRTVADAVAQLGECWTVCLDAGPLEPHEPSTVVEVTDEAVILRRHGAVSVQALREICPDLQDAASG